MIYILHKKLKPVAVMINALIVVCIYLSFPAFAQVSADYYSGGAVRVGASTTTCDNSAKGGIRYNTTSDKLEFCDATSWKEFTASPNPVDCTPAAFTFTDVTAQPISSLILSDSVVISGIDSGCTVSVSGAGSPLISVNGGAWTSATTINAGDSVQVRQTSSSAVNTALLATVTVGTLSDDWSVTTQTYKLRIFRTAGTYSGNLGGLSGADAICETEAGSAGYVGTWKAILSDSSTNAKDRLTLSYPIARLGTTTIVESTNLWGGSLEAVVNTASSASVWDGSSAAGLKDSSTCSDWSSSSSGSSGRRGDYGYTNSSWLAFGYGTCNNLFYLYCVEQ